MSNAIYVYDDPILEQQIEDEDFNHPIFIGMKNLDFFAKRPDTVECVELLNTFHEGKWKRRSKNSIVIGEDLTVFYRAFELNGKVATLVDDKQTLAVMDFDVRQHIDFFKKLNDHCRKSLFTHDCGDMFFRPSDGCLWIVGGDGGIWDRPVGDDEDPPEDFELECLSCIFQEVNKTVFSDEFEPEPRLGFVICGRIGDADADGRERSHSCDGEEEEDKEDESIRYHGSGCDCYRGGNDLIAVPSSAPVAPSVPKKKAISCNSKEYKNVESLPKTKYIVHLDVHDHDLDNSLTPDDIIGLATNHLGDDRWEFTNNGYTIPRVRDHFYGNIRNIYGRNVMYEGGPERITLYDMDVREIIGVLHLIANHVSQKVVTDGGETFYNPISQTVWITAGDGGIWDVNDAKSQAEGCGGPCTCLSETINEVKLTVFGDECSPAAEEGFVYCGQAKGIE